MAGVRNVVSVSVVDLMTALARRWTVAAAIALLVAGLTIAWAMSRPRVYESSASILFDAAGDDPVDDDSAPNLPAAFIGTQADIIRSSAISEEVAARLQLDEAERQRLNARPEELPNIRSRIGRRLAAAVEVRSGRQSNVVMIGYRSNEAADSAAIANAFAETYLQKQLELRVAPARSFSTWYDEQSAQARSRLEDAQARLSAYQREKGIIGVNRMDLEAERLRALSAELSQAEAATAAATAQASSPNVPEVSSSQVVQGLRSSVAAKQGDIAELSRTLGPNHPAMKAAQAELSALRGQLNAATAQARTSLVSASAAARSREAQLRARMGAQQQRMLQISPDQDQLMVLQRDVDGAREAYDSIRQRMSEMALRGQVSQTNASLLDRAQVPLLPSSPNIPLLMLLGMLLGTMLGVTIVVLLEFLRPKVRTAKGIEQVTGVPVLVDLSSSARSLRVRAQLSPVEAVA